MQSMLSAVLSNWTYNRAKVNSSAWLETFSSQVEAWGASDAIGVHNSSTSGDGAVLLAGNNLYVTFRGTEDGGDVITDITFRPANITLGGSVVHVHEGFLDATLSVWPQVLAAADQLDPAQNKTLLFTGHSLGGAMAVIGALLSNYDVAGGKLANGTRAVKGVWTYGAPAVGNNTLAQAYAANGLENITFRFENNNDVVPLILLGLPRRGKLVWLNNDTCKSSRPADQVLKLSVSDHYMAGYIAGVEHCLSACATQQLEASCPSYDLAITPLPSSTANGTDSSSFGDKLIDAVKSAGSSVKNAVDSAVGAIKDWFTGS